MLSVQWWWSISGWKWPGQKCEESRLMKSRLIEGLISFEFQELALYPKAVCSFSCQDALQNIQAIESALNIVYHPSDSGQVTSPFQPELTIYYWDESFSGLLL